jgi:DNA ligase (NAD+)
MIAEILRDLSLYTNVKLTSRLKKLDLNTLKSLKEYLDDKYYNTGEKCEFTDDQYDRLKNLILGYEKKEKSTVGAPVRDDNNRVKLPYWLGSLDKIKPEEKNKLDNWFKKNKSDKYLVENKLDGISCLLVCNKGKINLYTRGDGNIGADITHILTYLKHIPLLKNNLAVRGELIINEKLFNKKYAKDSANPRNMVSGLVNSKNLKTELMDVDFIAYELITNDEYQVDAYNQLKLLKEYGFKVVEHLKLNLEDFDADTLSEILLTNRRNSDYEIDGIIVQPIKEYKRNTKDNPKYSFAFKMTIESNIVEAKVEEIEWNISKHKLLKPRIKITPINLNGVTITYASGFNAKFIMENSLGKNSIVKITRSGDVIPFIVEVVKSSATPSMPEFKYKWNENNVDIIIEDDEENISEIKMISSFFSGMGIKNISDATVQKIYKEGYTTLIKIFKASKEDFEKIEGFQKRLAEKIYNNIHEGLKNTTKDLILGSSGIFGEGLGKRKIKVLIDHFPDILESTLSEKELMDRITSIPSYSDKTAEKILNNLDRAKKFMRDIDPFVTYDTTNIPTISEATATLENITVLFSGFRDQDLEKKILSRGGKILTSVSKNLKILIVKNISSSTSKIEKARSLNVDILLYDEFTEKYL